MGRCCAARAIACAPVATTCATCGAPPLGVGVESASSANTAGRGANVRKESCCLQAAAHHVL
eukprot:740968-Prymnesium_polylepis.1